MSKQYTASEQSERIALRLKFFFAALSCMGGAVLSSGTETSFIPIVAIFFGIFGFVFVDWLELFSLPPIAAYAAMAVAALICMGDFAELDAPGNHQMIAVAQLLVFVQAILMLQKKTRRILEQLAVFCLLELIVSAVFNNAISYGLILIPIAVVAAWALSLLASLTASDGLQSGKATGLSEELKQGVNGDSKALISVSAEESFISMTGSALSLPRVAFVTLAPAVLLVASIFFYALPRTTDAARVQNRSNAIVGFSDELELAQIGQMMQSSQAALRVYTSHQNTGKPYPVVGGLYLRGRALEEYTPRMSSLRNSAIWTSAPSTMLSEPSRLPQEFVPERESDEEFYDKVDVRIICESTRSNAVFGIAPYHRLVIQPEIAHQPERWTLSRFVQEDWVFPRIEYRFGTHAFRSGIQSELTTYRDIGDPSLGGLSIDAVDAQYRTRRNNEDQKKQQQYLDVLLEFDPDTMPTAADLAAGFATDRQGVRRTDYQIAKAMERHFVTAGKYGYTLNLDAESIPGLDPIEQFLLVDRRGHCQYFASALAMMLRSEGIPARIVAGYHTDEYNELGEHFVARQLHAHAWVEALVDRNQLGANRRLYGQTPSEKVWLRLDPTPAGGRVRESAGGVGQVIDMAQNMWDDYVVDMDGTRQDRALIGSGANPMNRSYKQLVDWLSNAISRIRAGQLGGGALASGDFFSWQAAVLAGVVGLVFIILLRLRPPEWLRRRFQRDESTRVPQPSIDFYAETLRQLERIGIHRRASQTPDELTSFTERLLEPASGAEISAPLKTLTSAFYEHRFGDASDRPDLEKVSAIEHAHGRDLESNHVLESDRGQLERALAKLTRCVDSMVVHRGNAEHGT